VGIGTSVPTQALDVNGQVRVRGAQGAAGQLLGLADDGTLQVQPPTFSAVAPAFMPTPPVDLGTVPVSPKPQAIVLDPTATRAYVTSQNGSARGQLDAYDLGLDGLPVRRGTVPVGFGPRALVMHPAGIRLYVVNMTDNTLQAFDISGAGLPVSLGVVPTGRGPVAVAVNPAGTRLYVTNSADNRLQTYDITGSGLPVSLGVVRTGRSPVGVVLHPAGTRAYVLQYAPGNLFIYDLNGGGIPIGLVSMGPHLRPRGRPPPAGGECGRGGEQLERGNAAGGGPAARHLRRGEQRRYGARGGQRLLGDASGVGGVSAQLHE
jgi:hypothetical protein